MPFAAEVSPGLCAASSRKDPTPSCELSNNCSQGFDLIIQLKLETHVFAYGELKWQKAKPRGFRQGKSQQCCFSQQPCRQTAAPHTTNSPLGRSHICLRGVVGLQHEHQAVIQDRFLEVFAPVLCRQIFPKLVGKTIQFFKHTGE